MMELARQRVSLKEFKKSIEFRVLAIEEIAQVRSNGPFDGALSNFSGLNCVQDLAAVARDLASLLRPRASVLSSMIGRLVPWELVAVQYALPDFIRLEEPLWFRRAWPYAHYVLEGSQDGAKWFVLTDRTHGPWRGRQTDFFGRIDLHSLRFRGTFSNGEPFRVEQVKVFRPN